MHKGHALGLGMVEGGSGLWLGERYIEGPACPVTWGKQGFVCQYGLQPEAYGQVRKRGGLEQGMT